ncbi:MAG: PEP-CTERM sorting domain-containing protein [Verrucomicrobiota bacterium]
MKKSFLTLALCAVTTIAFGQGAFDPTNIGSGANSTSVNAPVFNVDMSTPLASSVFKAQWYAGTVGTAEGSLQAIGTPLSFSSSFPGFFFGSAVTVSGVGIGQQATLQLRAWDSSTGATWESATVRGQSTTFTSPALGDSFNPLTIPVAQGLTSFSLAVVPEPSTIALGVLGGLALLLRRRK